MNSSVIKNQTPAVMAYLCLVFSTPFSSGSPLHLVFGVAWMLLFIFYVFFHTRKYPFSLLMDFRKYHSPAFYLLLLFGISSLISYLCVMFGNVSVQHKIFASMRYFIYWLMAFYVLSLARFVLIESVSHSKVFTGYMSGTLVLIAILLVIYHVGDAPSAYMWATRPPLGEHVRIMGMIASVAVLVAMVLLLIRMDLSRYARIFLWLSLLVCSAFLIWTGSRASMALVVLMAVLMIALGRLYLKTGYYKIAMIIIALLLSVGVADKFSVFKWSGLHRALQVSSMGNVTGQLQSDTIDNGNAAFESGDKLTSGRMNMWRITIQSIQQAPIFGSGPYGYFFIPDRPNEFDHPHNLVLQFLVEWGITGTLLLLTFLAYLLWQGIRNIPDAFRQKDTDYLIAASVFFVLTLTGLVDGTYFLSQPLFCLATAFAIFPFFTKKRKVYFDQHVIRHE